MLPWTSRRGSALLMLAVVARSRSGAMHVNAMVMMNVLFMSAPCNFYLDANAVRSCRGDPIIAKSCAEFHLARRFSQDRGRFFFAMDRSGVRSSSVPLHKALSDKKLDKSFGNAAELASRSRQSVWQERLAVIARRSGGTVVRQPRRAGIGISGFWLSAELGDDCGAAAGTIYPWSW